MTRKRPFVDAMQDLENKEALDAGVQAVRPFIQSLVSNDAVRGALQGDWVGHAIHPAVVVLPQGLWASAVALDLLRPGKATDEATLLTGLGILSTLPAVLTGAAEIATANQKQKRVGVVHASANTVALTLQVASWASRRRGKHGRGALLSVVAMGFMGFAGFLGGHLAVARKVGSHDPAFGPE